MHRKFMNNDQYLGRIREDLRGVSRQAFGKLHRLETVAVTGALEPPIWSRRLAKSLDIGENQVASELVNLMDLGALQRFPAEHDRRKIYQPLPHPIWVFARQLLEETVRRAAPEEEDGDPVARYWSAVLDGFEPVPIPQ
jgi:hypothetical protein